jgi:hypothetical protein
MPVLSHAKERAGERERRLQEFCIDFAAALVNRHALPVYRQQACALRLPGQERFAHQLFIAVLVVRGHPALVAQDHVDV